MMNIKKISIKTRNNLDWTINQLIYSPLAKEFLKMSRFPCLDFIAKLLMLGLLKLIEICSVLPNSRYHKINMKEM